MGVMRPQAQECRAPRGAGEGRTAPPDETEGSGQHPDPTLSPREHHDNELELLSAPQFTAGCSSNPKGRIRHHSSETSSPFAKRV